MLQLTIHIGNINQQGYRSYYFDQETGLYYLNSRYYSPEFGRFINADDILGANEDILSYNLYAYVSNNPINYSDHTGYGKTYVFYYYNKLSSANFDLQAKNSPYYNINSKNVIMVPVGTGDEFVKAWNNMSGEIDNVYMYLHGDKGYLIFYKENFKAFNRLNYKKINGTVFLMSCYGGAAPSKYQYSVAERISQKTNARVRANTGKVSYQKISGKYYARSSFTPLRFLVFGDIHEQQSSILKK